MIERIVFIARCPHAEGRSYRKKPPGLPMPCGDCGAPGGYALIEYRQYLEISSVDWVPGYRGMAWRGRKRKPHEFWGGARATRTEAWEVARQLVAHQGVHLDPNMKPAVKRVVRRQLKRVK